jgi:Flp pilus assembly pilin Flp
MLNFIKNFRNDEDGAVTVDWVVLTAAIVGLGIAVLTSVGGSAVTTADGAGVKIEGAGNIDYSGGT